MDFVAFSHSCDSPDPGLTVFSEISFYVSVLVSVAPKPLFNGLPGSG
jgi:hypothetical protein